MRINKSDLINQKTNKTKPLSLTLPINFNFSIYKLSFIELAIYCYMRFTARLTNGVCFSSNCDIMTAFNLSNDTIARIKNKLIKKSMIELKRSGTEVNGLKISQNGYLINDYMIDDDNNIIDLTQMFNCIKEQRLNS